ncbi:MAG: hypothetical protein ACRDKS_11745, partial [Actinomycetota bacterium]
MRGRRSTKAGAAACALAALLASTIAGVSGAATPCPSEIDDAAFSGTAELLADNQVMSDLGRRPTGSAAQTAWIDWLDAQLQGIAGLDAGLDVESVPYMVNRWDEGVLSLEAGPSSSALSAVEPSGFVPYAKPTLAGGVTAQLKYVAAGTALAGQDIAGKIVVRDAVPGTVPFAAFRAVEWFEWDPDLTLIKDIASNYERDFAGYLQRVADLKDAAAEGAAALIFVHGFPREQVRDQYAPYEGLHWDVPALYVGVDEGEALKGLAASGGVAHVSLSASDASTVTRTLIATLPGASEERMVIESHTDGMNAVWDNGPVGILALARYFAALPVACRPRTLQFVFTTGHLYQHLLGTEDRGGGAELEAQQLDKDYDDGTLAMVFAMEHLGAREYAAVPRAGAPGRELVQTGRNEVNTIFVGETPVLIAAVDTAVLKRDLRRTFVMRGADAPAAFIPPHQSYGGEGGAYQQHLIPTIALVTGPWSLYNPAFGMEAIDGALMRTQTLLFADLIND